MQLIVLGMHRSGTSVLARLLNLMGAYFGPEGSSTGANEENPKGFWERRDVRNLNDMVLHAMGCDWNRISTFDPDAIPGPVAAEFNRAASRLVLDLDAHRPWMLKEPRLCLLFPLWRPLLEAPVCIHVYRHPAEVAASLLRRNGIPMEAGLALWEKYVRIASGTSAGLPAVTVSHHALMTEPVREVERLHAALERNGVRLRLPEPAEVDAFVQPGLYRERQDRDDLAPYASAPQVKLFESLVAQRSPSIAGRNQVSAKSQRALRDYEAGLPAFQPPVKPAPAPPALDRKAFDSLRAELGDFGKKTAAALESLVRDEKDQERRSSELVAAHARELAAVRESAGTAKARLERDVVKLREAVEASKAAAAATKAKLEREAADLREAVAATKAAAGASKAKLEREAADLRVAAAEAKASATAAAAQLETSRQATRDALEEVARQARAFGELQERARQDREARDREIARLEARAGEAEARLATLGSTRAMLEAAVNARVRDIGAMAGMLMDTARAERDGEPDAEKEKPSNG